MHSVADFTECIPIPINIKTSKQIHIYPALPGTPFSKLKHLSIAVYLATTWRSWTQCIFLITVTNDTETRIAN